MGKQWETLFWGAPKSLQMVTATMKLKDACSLEKKTMANLDSILKSRDITLPTKVCLVKAMFYPGAAISGVAQSRTRLKRLSSSSSMYGCESWTIKKAECWRPDAFEQWCWRRLLRVSWTWQRSNESILEEISPEYSLEGLMLKRKLQYLGHQMWRTDSFEKTLMLGKFEVRRRRGR